MTDLKSRLAGLNPAQRAELLNRLRVNPLPRADRSMPLPLSFSQRRLWFLERLDGTSAAYNMPAAFRLRGELDHAALSVAINEIVNRHEVLRTRLLDSNGDANGEPAQVIDNWQAFSIPTVELASEEQMRELLRDEARRVFNLENDHPIRARLVRLGDNDHVLCLTLHHVACDGWSTEVLIREFSILYNAFKAGKASPLPELPLQYADYSAWQHRELAEGDKVAQSLDYWRSQLAGVTGLTGFPTDFPRSSHQGAEGGQVWFMIADNTVAQLNALAKETDTTLFMVMLTALAVLLHRWSGDTDVTVGSPIANRPRKELEGLIGFFVNTLALRVRMEDDPTFHDLLLQVRGVTLDAYSHAELPFEQLVEKLNPERRLNQSPFFQVMLAMQSGPVNQTMLDGLAIEPLPLSTGASRLDMTFSMRETAEGIAGNLEFATLLFRPDTAQRLTEHLRNLLAAAALRPDTPISQLEMLSHGERHRLLVEWNRTSVDYDRTACLHQFFERQARATPDAIALRHRNTAWTYRQLLEVSGQIALLLRNRGVGPDSLVAVCLDRAPLLIATLLGVLRAGGAYVALDPAYPVSRLRFILEDTAAPVVLTSAQLAAGMDEAIPAGAEIVRLDAIELPAAAEPLPEIELTPTNLAYVLYTSGSTGRPKGVAIEHRSPVALISWARSVWPLEELRGVLAGTSTCFDLSVFEIFLPLAAGGTVILAGNVLELPSIECRDQVTLVNTVPSAIDTLLRQDGIPPSVRVVNLAGEPLSTELADGIYGVLTVRKVYDLYGPSEDTTYSTFILRKPGDPASIGRPIANTRLYILDKALQPVPVGSRGEICLAGDGLARGYLGRQDLTDERFVPSPFPGAGRLYRTGDLARFRPDGNVEFLGRIDQQIKIRGFRIEPGEIETVLGGFPGVGRCLVIVLEAEGEKRLVAYVTHPSGETAVPALQSHLRTRLPEYMIPSAIVVLEALPLTPNGKIDRGALPPPEFRHAPQSSRRLTPEEELLKPIWEDLLRIERINPDDDFFSLGGHSLLAARLRTRIRNVFQVDIPLRAIFEHPTLCAQAGALARLRGVVPYSQIPIPVLESRDRLPLSFAQGRLWFLDHLEGGSPAYNMPGAVRISGAINLPALLGAFDRVVARHEILRTAFRTFDGKAFAVPANHLPVLLVRDLRDLSGQERHAALNNFLREDAETVFDLVTGPLIRAAVMRVSDAEIMLSVTMHHVVSDGWSVSLFLNELCRFYTSSAPMPALGIQYADFAAWQRARFEAGEMAPQLAFWRELLAGAPALLELPLDRPRGAAQTYRGASVDVALKADLRTQVIERNREYGVTSFMTLLTAFAVLLSRYSGQQDIVVGFPAAGRNRTDLEPLIGLFVNTLPFRLTIANAATFEELLSRTRALALDALNNQDVPFEKLVEELGVERNLAWSPVFQVMFVMQNESLPVIPEGLHVEAMPALETHAAKFDLTLAVAEHSDRFVASFEYNRDLFDKTTVQRMAGHFAELLGAALQNPRTPVAQLEIMPEAERLLLLRDWNATEFPSGGRTLIHEWIADVALRHPSRIAVRGGAGESFSALTYAQLMERSRHIAASLRARGVQPEERIGICMARTPEMVAAMIGVLLAGCAYVPLDPMYPAERLSFMLRDSGAKIVLREASDAASETMEPVPPIESAGDRLAYVLYTSGSTGTPKGVAIEHRSVVALIQWALRVCQKDDLACVLAGTSICFDLSIFEIFVTLAAGGTVLVAENALALPQYARSGVTLLNTVPSAIEELVRNSAIPDSVRVINLAGEPLKPELVDRIYASSHAERVFDLYGPSEDTTYSTWALRSRGGPQTIGKPIDNTRIYIVDAADRLVPIGVPGEILLAGSGLARGYLDRPELTAERFTANPFSSSPSDRVYRTGDLARWRPDGTIEFIGRQDYQIKIRGFRVELGEVEARLREHPGIRDAVVVFRRSDMVQQLAAYVVPKAPGAVADGLVSALNRHAEETLPAYMRPAVFVTLAALPLTPNGKIDRKALPEPLVVAPGSGFTEPSTRAEVALAEVWCEVLNRSRVGARDNFFALGGDSIVSIRVIAKLRERGWRIHAKDVFRHQTLQALAAAAERIGQAEAAPDEEQSASVALTPVQQLFFSLNPPVKNHFNQALLLLADPDLPAEHLELALRETQRCHPALRSRFHRTQEGWLRQTNPRADVTLEVHDLSGQDPVRRTATLQRICDERQRRLDLEAGPVFRAALFQCGETEPARVLLIAHHLVVDAVSWGIILDDIQTVCSQLSKDANPALPREHCGPGRFLQALKVFRPMKSIGIGSFPLLWIRFSPSSNP